MPNHEIQQTLQQRIGGAIRIFRERAQISQSALAQDLLGNPKNTPIYRWERGVSVVPAHVLIKLLDILNIKYGEFLNEVNYSGVNPLTTDLELDDSINTYDKDQHIYYRELSQQIEFQEFIFDQAINTTSDTIKLIQSTMPEVLYTDEVLNYLYYTVQSTLSKEYEFSYEMLTSFKELKHKMRESVFEKDHIEFILPINELNNIVVGNGFWGGLTTEIKIAQIRFFIEYICRYDKFELFWSPEILSYVSIYDKAVSFTFQLQDRVTRNKEVLEKYNRLYARTKEFAAQFMQYELPEDYSVLDRLKGYIEQFNLEIEKSYLDNASRNQQIALLPLMRALEYLYELQKETSDKGRLYELLIGISQPVVTSIQPKTGLEIIERYESNVDNISGIIDQAFRLTQIEPWDFEEIYHALNISIKRGFKNKPEDITQFKDLVANTSLDIIASVIRSLESNEINFQRINYFLGYISDKNFLTDKNAIIFDICSILEERFMHFATEKEQEKIKEQKGKIVLFADRRRSNDEPESDRPKTGYVVVEE